MPDFPRDPLISRYPAPMTAAEARREVRRAAQLRRRVPLGHPYGLVPLWTPYPIAKLVAAVARALSERPRQPPKGRGRRRSGRSR